MDVDGSNVRQLVNSPGLDDKPQWSPDGSRIGFATTRSGSPELRAVDPDTGVEEPLLPQPVRGINPAWTVDGSQLAYNVVTSAGFDIAVMAADGTGRRSVVAESGVGGTATVVAGRPVARVLLRRGRVVGRLRRRCRDRRQPGPDAGARVRRAAGVATRHCRGQPLWMTAATARSPRRALALALFR